MGAGMCTKMASVKRRSRSPFWVGCVTINGRQYQRSTRQKNKSDDYSFGILQSGIHWSWFIATCSKLKGDFRYTPESVFDTFPWPQKPKHEDIKAVAEAAVTLRALRQETMRKLNYSLPPRAIFRFVFSI